MVKLFERSCRKSAETPNPSIEGQLPGCALQTATHVKR
jgi:hypothetical protein